MNCFSTGVLIVGWFCAVTITMRMRGSSLRASMAAVMPAIPLPMMTSSARSPRAPATSLIASAICMSCTSL